MVAGIVVAVIVLAHPPWAVAPDEPTVAPAGAHLPAPPAPEPAPPPPPPAKAIVKISLDSTPQDAKVVRADSGEALGRTPLTIAIPQGSEVISFRFEKDGHASITYKVIPDLDKSVRAELLAGPIEEPKRAPAPPHARPAAAHARAAASNREARPSTPAAVAPSAAEQPRDCLMSIASFPWSELWIDGKDTGQRTPVVHYPVSCGAHKLTLKRRDLKLERVQQVTVAPGHELKQHYELSDEYGDN